jgi:hypothetical protein
MQTAGLLNMNMEEHAPFENPEPGVAEKLMRFIGAGTYHVFGMEDRSQGEQRLAVQFHERGGEGFRILRSAETGLRQYRREVKAARKDLQD